MTARVSRRLYISCRGMMVNLRGRRDDGAVCCRDVDHSAKEKGARVHALRGADGSFTSTAQAGHGAWVIRRWIDVSEGRRGEPVIQSKQQRKVKLKHVCVCGGGTVLCSLPANTGFYVPQSQQLLLPRHA